MPQDSALTQLFLWQHGQLMARKFSYQPAETGVFTGKGDAAVFIWCPICHRDADKILTSYQVTARTDEGETRVGGLKVYSCTAGHIFFVREADIPRIISSDNEAA